MSQENLELVRRIWDADRRRDWDAVYASYAEDVEWEDNAGLWGDWGVARGREGIREAWLRWHEAFEDVTFELGELTDAGDLVVATYELRARGRSSGAQVRQPLTLVWTLAAGRAVRIRSYASREEALGAVGPREEPDESRNVDTVRRIYRLAMEAWESRPRAASDLAGEITELWDPELVIEENHAFPDAASYRGYEGLARWWRGFFDVYDELELEPLDFTEHGERVMVLTRHRLQAKSGVLLEREIIQVWTLRDGRALHVTGYMDRSDALAALGLQGR
jgi:ketosteroid isomerase-like protein